MFGKLIVGLLWMMALAVCVLAVSGVSGWGSTRDAIIPCFLAVFVLAIVIWITPTIRKHCATNQCYGRSTLARLDIQGLVSDGGEPWGYFSVGEHYKGTFYRAVQRYVKKVEGVDIGEEQCLCPLDSVEHGTYRFVRVEGRSYDDEFQACEPWERDAFCATFVRTDI